MWTQPPPDFSLSLSGTQAFTTVTPSLEGVFILLGHSKKKTHKVKVAPVEACPCFQTRRQPVMERQITWTRVDRPRENGDD